MPDPPPDLMENMETAAHGAMRAGDGVVPDGTGTRGGEDDEIDRDAELKRQLVTAEAHATPVPGTAKGDL